ncbi:hypothetical protein [Paraburkholderia haematera]|uniref:Uncharacterized protein n=1 Tax=Paraburkholderia haematera TaxID=2793077 RepID=A0ABM8R4L7_9BURK|nr:hypothetical protein [Paraburkholderia haematera]CAE6732229.1 hypothetical protein R69888_02117 [Paraburkholderia haematera]
MPTPATHGLRDDDGALGKPSPMVAVAVMVWPEPVVSSVLHVGALERLRRASDLFAYRTLIHYANDLEL